MVQLLPPTWLDRCELKVHMATQLWGKVPMKTSTQHTSSGTENRKSFIFGAWLVSQCLKIQMPVRTLLTCLSLNLSLLTGHWDNQLLVSGAIFVRTRTGFIFLSVYTHLFCTTQFIQLKLGKDPKQKVQKSGLCPWREWGGGCLAKTKSLFRLEEQF